ncbi:S8 family serine peptidase [Acidiferrimicrobium sp. IK]|uniref:S8 family serine peptidase n=1 Tax=Acidiferrimicrobium sp. IK TaxID=2871700 RepID=UPI0021CB70DC|nr:S8 family serine peptidase [Acidiferrimicrobium sp. IK]MCU4186085.1 S8 family serine peptidase [Acidiferrimicrobium sp. IK]
MPKRPVIARLGVLGAAALSAGVALPLTPGSAAAAPTAPIGQLAGPQAAALATGATHPVIVLFKDQLNSLPATPGLTPQRKAAVASQQAPVVAELHQLNAPHLKTYSVLNALSANVSAAEERRLASDSAVAAVVPDQTAHLSFKAPAAPTTPAAAAPSTACQPGPNGVELDPQALEAIHADSNLPGAGPTASSLGITGKGVTVAFIAEGFQPNQPNFLRRNGKSVVVDEKDFTGEGIGTVSGGEASLDASSIGAQGTSVYTAKLSDGTTCKFNVLGAAPGADIVGLKVFPTNYDATTSAILQAIDYAVTVDHVNVLNESFGYNPLPDTMTDVVRQADEQATEAGTLVDVSSGDAGPTNTVGSPSTDPAVLSAGASTTYRVYAQEGITPSGVAFNGWEDNNLSSLSSSGFTEGLKGPNLIAPGDLNWVSCQVSATQYGACISGGTSEAAPLTSATAALVIQAYRKTHHGATPTPALIKQIITSTATDVGLPADQQGAGLLNAYQAVLAAESVKTADGSPRGKGMTLQTSPDTIAATAPAGTTVTQPVTVTNSGSGTQTVHLAGRVLSDPTTLAARRLKATSASYQQKLTFTVAPGTSYLAAHAALAAADQNGFVDVSLIDPFGRLAIDGLPQGSTLTSNVGVRYPAAGTWTAYVTYQGDVAPSSPIDFVATGQSWQPFGTVTPSSITLAPGASKTVSVAVATPATAGDETAAITLTSPFGQPASIPVALRSLVPLTGGTGTFSVPVFGGNGRGGAPATTQYFSFDVPQGTPELNVSTRYRNGNADNYSLFLVSPTGEALGHASNQLAVGGTTSSPVTVTEVGAASHVLAPAAGRWTAIVAFANPASGPNVSSALDGKITLAPVAATATGLPTGSVALKSSKVVAVTVHNTSGAPQAYFLDPRLNQTVTQTLQPYNSSASVTLPLPTATPIPQFIVPTDTTGLAGQLDATAPATFDMSPYLGDFGGELNGDPQVAATSTGDSATATWTDNPVTPGDWNVDPALVGVFTQQGATPAPAHITLQATTQAFDPAVTTTYGDLWQTGTVNPVIVQPGQTTTLYAVMKPTAAGPVSGTLYVDTASELSPFGQAIPAGDQVAAVPYSYTAAAG